MRILEVAPTLVVFVSEVEKRYMLLLTFFFNCGYYDRDGVRVHWVAGV